MRVLLVEDQRDFAGELGEFLKREGFLCDFAYNCSEATEQLGVNPYDFVLIDLGLPDGDGFEVLAHGKEVSPTTLFIIITARAEVDDRVKGLLEGADDYLSKPFSFIELHARMQAILRRKSGWNSQELNFGGFVLNTTDRILKHQSEVISLTKKEFDLLHFLLINKNRVLNRFQLAEHIWAEFFEDDHQSNFIDVHIKNIRKKLGKFESMDRLETVRGLGYRINI
jgi:DNA-binding response OmpR family regulator